jgi:hypothetical protein
MHASMQQLQNAPAYFALSVSYKLKMLLILTPVTNFIKLLGYYLRRCWHIALSFDWG